MDDTQLTRATALFKSLADPTRLRILGLLAERPHAGYELAARLELSPPTISHHMRKLVAARLSDVTPDAQTRIYSLRLAPLRELAQAGDEKIAGSARLEEDELARAFFDGPRLRQIPSSRKKRVLVLRRLLRQFDPERSYPEREVNDILRAAHEDVATLRRELVNYGFMTRDRGTFRVAAETPPRGATVRQEVGNEAEWFQALVARATAQAVSAATPPTSETPSVPRE